MAATGTAFWPSARSTRTTTGSRSATGDREAEADAREPGRRRRMSRRTCRRRRRCRARGGRADRTRPLPESGSPASPRCPAPTIEAAEDEAEAYRRRPPAGRATVRARRQRLAGCRERPEPTTAETAAPALPGRRPGDRPPRPADAAAAICRPSPTPARRVAAASRCGRAAIAADWPADGGSRFGGEPQPPRLPMRADSRVETPTAAAECRARADDRCSYRRRSASSPASVAEATAPGMRQRRHRSRRTAERPKASRRSAATRSRRSRRPTPSGARTQPIAPLQDPGGHQAPPDHAGAGRQGRARQQGRGADHLPVARRALLRADAEHRPRRRRVAQDHQHRRPPPAEGHPRRPRDPARAWGSSSAPPAPSAPRPRSSATTNTCCGCGTRSAN